MNILRPLSPHLPIYKPQLTSTFPISHRISGAFLATIVLFFYLLCLKIGLICLTYNNFYKFFFYSSKLILISVEMTALALSYHLYNGVRHLLADFYFSGFPFFLKKKRMQFCILLIAFFLFCSIDAAPAEGLQSHEWLDLPANMQPRVREPQVPEPQLFVPEVPTLEPPLIPDAARRAILYERIGPQAYVFQIPLETVVDLVYQQAEIERHIEACLIADGIPVGSLQQNVNGLRSVLFSPQGTLLSRATLARHLLEITRNGTRQSIPYRRVYRAIRNYDLFIDLPIFFRR
uniref:succinate dehydrogenase subunit 3 n=1 Tax=Rheum palmatum TaxID=137221 RepID=UPI00286C70BA|nr:succinate dehydrogenase subunit 3 [Rheum palmatum]WKL06586.1 succinate dehydrogenase subunit 3 [Rheum palmatum]